MKVNLEDSSLCSEWQNIVYLAIEPLMYYIYNKRKDAT